MNEAIYVGGRWIASATAQTIDVVDPATERLIGRVPAGSVDDVEAAVSAARRAFDSWAAVPVARRCAYVGAVADGLADRRDALARAITLDVGCPLRIAERVQVDLPLAIAETFRDDTLCPPAEELGDSLVVREPIGVVGAITAWNYPLYLIVAKVLPALAAGCTVVLKPSEVAPLAAYRFAEVVDAAGIPPGVFNMVSGTGRDVGEALVAHPDVDMVSFTGSTPAGARVAEVASRTVKRVALELGGKAPCVILPDADLGTAVKAGIRSAFLNSGQTCTATTRMLVHQDQRDQVVELADAIASTYRTGAPGDRSTRLGPVVSAAQRDRVRGYIRTGIDEGATLVCGGWEAPDDLAMGYFVRPTIFADVTPEMTVAREEIFGPVLSVLTYTDEDDAVRIANATRYGLAAAVWAGDAERAMRVARRIRAGQVDVNGAPFNPLAPFGGYQASGNGRELGRHGMAEFLEIKAIQRPPAATRPAAVAPPQ